MNDYELIQIENAYEDAADLMREQDMPIADRSPSQDSYNSLSQIIHLQPTLFSTHQ